MSKRHLLSALVLLLTISWGPAKAAEWNSVAESTSRIGFSIDVRKKFAQTGWDDNYSHRAFRVVVPADTTSEPRAEIYYFELAPGRFFPVVTGPKGQLAKFNYTKSSFSDVGPEQAFGGPLLIRYSRFKRGARNCIIFVGALGDGAGDAQTSAGTSELKGYYCGGEGRVLAKPSPHEILGAISIGE